MELKTWQLCSLLFFLSAGVILPVKSQSRSKAESILATSDSANNFAKDLYNVLERRGNVVLSPMSIFSALSMTSLGAKGQTQTQILRALHATPDPLNRNSGIANLIASIKESDSPFVTMEMSNFMWVPRGVSIKPDFARNIDEVFQTRVRDADFSRPEEVRLLVNNRISNSTRGKIQELLPRRSITSQTRLLLANAVYFKGTWLEPFDERETRYESFVHDSYNSRSSIVPMMHKSEVFRAAIVDDLDAKAILMLYNDNRHGLLLLLPNRHDGLNELEERYVKSGYTTTRIIQKLIHRAVNLTLPRFQIKFDAELSQSLQKLGVTELFSENADLSGLSSLAVRNRLRASGFFHQSTIEVNEGGSEASAATGMEITPLMGTSGYTGPIEFKADHPFMFFLVDELNGNVPLFMGRVTHPTTRDSGKSRSQDFDHPASPYPNRNRFSFAADNDNTPKYTSRPINGGYPTNPVRTNRPSYSAVSDEIIFPHMEDAYTHPSLPVYHKFENALRTNNLLNDYAAARRETFGSISYPEEDDIESSLAKRKKREALPWAWPGPQANQKVNFVAENDTVDERGRKDWHMQPLLTELLIPLSGTGNENGNRDSSSKPQSSISQNRPSYNAVGYKPLSTNPSSSTSSFGTFNSGPQSSAGSRFPAAGSPSFAGFGNNFGNDYPPNFPPPGYPPSQPVGAIGHAQPFLPVNPPVENLNGNLSPTAVIFPELALRIQPAKERTSTTP